MEEGGHYTCHGGLCGDLGRFRVAELSLWVQSLTINHLIIKAVTGVVIEIPTRRES